MLDEKFDDINHDASPWTPAIKYGIIWALLNIIIQIGSFLTGNLEKTMNGEALLSSIIMGAIGLAIIIFMIYKAVGDHKINRGGRISFGQAVSVGALTGLIYGLVTAIWTFVFYTFIFTGYESLMNDAMIAQYEGMDMDEDMIETSMNFAGMFVKPVFLAIFAIPGGVLTGTIVSLIIGAIMKTD